MKKLLVSAARALFCILGVRKVRDLEHFEMNQVVGWLPREYGERVVFDTALELDSWKKILPKKQGHKTGVSVRVGDIDCRLRGVSYENRQNLIRYLPKNAKLRLAWVNNPKHDFAVGVVVEQRYPNGRRRKS